MSISEKEQRLSEASELLDAIRSLDSVPLAQRKKFVHDRLILAIDGIIEKHHRGEAPFSDVQVDVLKDIAFQIAYITDPLNTPNKGFFGRLVSEFNEQTATEKVKTVFAVASVAATSLIGAYHILAQARQLATSAYIEMAIPSKSGAPDAEPQKKSGAKSAGPEATKQP